MAVFLKDKASLLRPFFITEDFAVPSQHAGVIYLVRKGQPKVRLMPRNPPSTRESGRCLAFCHFLWICWHCVERTLLGAKLDCTGTGRPLTDILRKATILPKPIGIGAGPTRTFPRNVVAKTTSRQRQT